MLIILTSGNRSNYKRKAPQSKLENTPHEPDAAARGGSRDAAARFRSHDRLRARPRSSRRARAPRAPSHPRLDLGFADGGRGDQFVLDPSDTAARPVEPDPSAVDLRPGDAPARGMARAYPPRRRSSPDHDPDVQRRPRRRRAVHAASRADHAHRRVRRLAGAETTARSSYFRFAESLPDDRFQRRVSGPRRGSPAAHLSLWKNEGKKRSPKPAKGRFGRPRYAI